MTVTPSEVTSPRVAQIAAAGGVAIQPIGATEQHGPHLPVTTDAVIATALAERAVTLLGEREAPPVWLLPTLAYGKSPEHSGIPGTITLSSTTMLAVCLDVARSVALSGIRTLVFVNAHGGNPELLQLVARDIRADSGVLAVGIHAPSLPLSSGLADRIPRPDLDVHAGYYETSIMLAVAPEAVDVAAALPDGLARADELAAGSAAASGGVFGALDLPWHTADVSGSGTIGDPTGANAEWGAAALAEQGAALADAIVEVARLGGELGF